MSSRTSLIILGIVILVVIVGGFFLYKARQGEAPRTWAGDSMGQHMRYGTQ